MKNIFIRIVLIVLLLSLFVNQSFAAIEWENTSSVVISHGYFDNGADCTIYIDGNRSDVTIQNVDIKLERIVNGNLMLIASWDDLSSGQFFNYNASVPNISRYYVYRLSFTAEVVCDGNVEYLSMYGDIDYRTNTKVY